MLDQNDCKCPHVPKNFATLLPPSYPVTHQQEQNLMPPVDTSFFDVKPILDPFVMSNGGEIDFSVDAWSDTNEANIVSERGSIHQHLYLLLEPNTPEVQMQCVYLSKHILCEKERRLKQNQNAHLAGPFVPVSVNSNKRRKIHGTQR